jgi:peptidoglycan hydrolase-like protein with peptidoglycan-binding domain
MRSTSTVVAITLVVLAALTTPAAASTKAPHAPASASWHGRAIQHPRPRPRSVQASWPAGWSAGPVGRGTGYVAARGSRRVRDVQRRLTRLGYRPGPIDGRFGPRTEAAARWFQYKHGLRSTGRIGRLTLAVLYARSENRPLRATTAPVDRTPAATPAPKPQPQPTTTRPSGGTPMLVFAIGIALALLAGLLVGMLLPQRRTGTPVLGYVARGGSAEVTATAPALEKACARRDWSLIRIVQEPADAGTQLAERPGLLHALEQIEAGTAEGLVVTGLRDFTTRFADLAALMQWLTAANGFLAAVDDDLDTSTPGGQATVTAMIDIASWRRQPFDGQRRRPQLEPRIAALQDRGLPATAIADALNLAGVPAPDDHDGWDPGDVTAAGRRAQEARS